MAKKKLKEHQIRAIERTIRKYVKRAGGFRIGISEAGKKTAIDGLNMLGRTKLEWDRTIDLNMINTKSIVRSKKGKNSID